MDAASLHQLVCLRMGAVRVLRSERIQSLWGGYGEALRLHLQGGNAQTVVVKHVQAPRNGGASHARKIRSFAVERAFYERHAPQSGATVAQAFHIECIDSTWVFLLEDLSAAGFNGRASRGSHDAAAQAMQWLANFHASFLHHTPDGLWPVGTYWQLDTRPDEWRAMPQGPLREAAQAIHKRLASATHQTFVHGDAKPANFCFGRSQAAAVDFQYVGGGCGMKDVAYFLWGESEASTERLLSTYFDALRPQLVEAHAVETEWRELYPWAVADFQRFLVGWAPGVTIPRQAERLTQSVLALL